MYFTGRPNSLGTRVANHKLTLFGCSLTPCRAMLYLSWVQQEKIVFKTFRKCDANRFWASLDQRTISSPLQNLIPIVSLASKTAWVSGGAVAAGCNNFPLQNFHRPFTRFKNRLRLDMLKMLYPQNGWVHCTKWPIHCTHFWAWPFQFSTASNPVWPQQCVAFFGWCHRVVNPPHGQQTGDRSLEHCLQCRKMILQS